MRLLFSDRAWDDYLWWQAHDRKTLERINTLIKDAICHPLEGIGKPEPLRGDLSGWWSRRITLEHRLVYRPADGILQIAQCRHHY